MPRIDDYGREPGTRYVSLVDRLPLVPFKTAKSTLFRLFRLFPAFRWIQAALPYPSNRSGRNGQNTRNTLLYGFSTQDGQMAILAILARPLLLAA